MKKQNNTSNPSSVVAPLRVRIQLPFASSKSKIAKEPNGLTRKFKSEFVALLRAMKKVKSIPVPPFPISVTEADQGMPDKFEYYLEQPNFFSQLRDMVDELHQKIEQYRQKYGKPMQKDLREVFKQLVKLQSVIAELEKIFSQYTPSVRLITFYFSGDDHDLDKLQKRILDLSRSFQHNLAVKHAWFFGATPCCKLRGYNPPTGSFCRPAHEIVLEPDPDWSERCLPTDLTTQELTALLMRKYMSGEE
jgi:hypothetical protein